MTKAAERKRETGSELIEAGERLFGRHGIDGVALRRIATEAGSANSSAVHYHFGGVDGFVRAIFAHRLPALEAERARLLAASREWGAAPDIGEMVDMLFRPFVTGDDVESYASYAAFLQEIFKAQRFGDWIGSVVDYPATRALADGLGDALIAKGERRSAWRIQIVSTMILAAIATGEATVEDGRFDEVIAMATAALVAD